MPCALNTLEVRVGTYHIKMASDALFTLIQKRSKVLLYNDIKSMTVMNDGGELIGVNNQFIRELNLYVMDGVVKNLTICYLHMAIEKYSIIHLNCNGYHTLKLDNTSEVIVNEIKVNSKL